MSEEENYNSNIESLIRDAKKFHATDGEIAACNKKVKCLQELVDRKREEAIKNLTEEANIYNLNSSKPKLK